MWAEWIGGLVDKSHSSEWISGICGIGGAILGSVIALFLTEFLSARRRKKDQLDRFAAAAFAAYQRLNQIYSITIIIRDHLLEGQTAAVKNQMFACLATRPIQQMSAPVVFPMDELWAITKIGGANTINALNSLDSVFNMLNDSMDDYSAARNELTDRMPPPSAMQGQCGTTMLSEDQLAPLLPMVADLNGRLDSLLPMANSLVDDSFRALVLIATAETKPLGPKFEMQMPDPSGKVVKFGAQIKIPVPVLSD